MLWMNWVTLGIWNARIESVAYQHPIYGTVELSKIHILLKKKKIEEAMSVILTIFQLEYHKKAKSEMPTSYERNCIFEDEKKSILAWKTVFLILFP